MSEIFFTYKKALIELGEYLVNVLEVKNLRKSFKNTEVLKGVTFSVGQKEILGFIGPNGSGKSTTMKCIATLLFADEGEISICGYDNIKDRSLALSEMSAQIESPGLYYNLRGIDNLKLFASLKNVDKSRVEEIIKFINIEKHLKRKVSEYSMGMKQRLALGIAMLSQPKFIMLDEPTNGLDPDGVISLRKTIFDLRDAGTSFLISSHQLSEIEKICDRVIAINNGKVLDISTYVDNMQRYHLSVDNVLKTKAILESSENLASYQFSKDVFELTFNDSAQLNIFLDKLRASDISILEISKVVSDIEDIYLEIYGDDYEKTD